MANFDALLKERQTTGSLRDRALSASYWHSIFETVGDANNDDGGGDSDGGESDGGESERCSSSLAAATADVVERGYFVTPRLIPTNATSRTLQAIEAVEAAGWPPVFAYVHDSVWDLLASPAVVDAMKSVIGDDAVQLPGLWAKRVTRDSDAGWSPHVDVGGAPKLRTDGRPARLSVWIPLTDATVDNGCMFVVPEDAVPSLSRDFSSQASMPTDDVIRLLHHARALPAPAGAILGWRETTLHWGGQSTGGLVDRVSLAVEFGHDDVELMPRELPAFPLGHRPDFNSRLALIGQSLLKYGTAKDREPAAFAFVSLGRALATQAR